MPSSDSSAPVDVASVARRVTGSLLRIRASSPFFGALTLFARFVPTADIPTACTDGRDVYYNPAFVAPLASAELDGLLLHEVLHAALLHRVRKGNRSHRRWGIAADIVVNGIVAAQPGLKLPAGGKRMPEIEHLSVEEIYALVVEAQITACPTCLEPPSAHGKGGEEDSGEASDKHSGSGGDKHSGSGGDKHSGSGAGRGPGTPAELEAHWHLALRQAEAVARSVGRGDFPAGMERLLGHLEPQLDWRARLWRFLVRTPTDFGDFDRRFVHQGLYLESLSGESLRAFIAVDTSGSIEGPLLDKFAGEVRGVLGAYPHIEAELYYADAELHGPFDVSAGHPLPAAVGGGGTRFEPFFERVEAASAAGVESVLLYLTDGFGSFPDTAPSAPVLWVVPPGGAPDESFPFGEVVRLLDDEGTEGAA